MNIIFYNIFNKNIIPDLSIFEYMIIGDSFLILFSKDDIKIFPINAVYSKLNKEIIENNPEILRSSLIVLPLTESIISYCLNNKYYMLSYENKEYHFWFLDKKENTMILKKQFKSDIKITDLKEWLNYEIYNFIKMLIL